MVTEPCITKDSYINTGKAPSNFMYDVIRKNECLTFINDQATEEASKDLTFCYKEALNKGLSVYNTKEKNISFSTLSADVGFPRDIAARIAITTVFKFIENNPNRYCSINFFVKKRSDFALYKYLLLQRTKWFHTIYLFYWMHKDKDNQNNVLAWLPKELRDYIISFYVKLLDF